VKNCSYCNIPHIKDNFDYIVEKVHMVVEMTKKR
jgi:Zn-finger protein